MMACAILFDYRLIPTMQTPLGTSKKRARRTSYSSIQSKYGSIPQGAFVLIKRKRKAGAYGCSSASLQFKALFENGNYELERMNAAEDDIPHLKLVLEPRARECILWVRFENRKTREVFCCLPVLVREMQRFAAVFVDTLATAGTTVAELRYTTVACIHKARNCFNLKHARRFLKKSDVLTMYTALKEVADDRALVAPPTEEEFLRMGAMCVRAMPMYDIEEHLHRYVNGRQRYHMCISREISADEHDTLESECIEQCESGMNRWLGTRRLVNDCI
jgi:hypothetical protein